MARSPRGSIVCLWTIAAVTAACGGSSPCTTCPTNNTTIFTTTPTTTTTSTVAQTTARYLGTIVAGRGGTSSALDLSLFFGLPSGSTSGLRAFWARPAAIYPVTGGFAIGSGGTTISGSLVGTVNGAPDGGTFTGVLDALVNGCAASRFYSGALTSAAVNWAAGDQIDTCGGASPLTFTVAANASGTPATVGSTIPTTIPGATSTTSTTTTVPGGAGSTSTTSVTTTVPPLSAGTVGYSPSGVGIRNATVFAFQLTTAPSGGISPYTYSWDFGDGSAPAAGASPTHVFDSQFIQNTFTVTVTVSDSRGSSAHTTASVQANAITGNWSISVPAAELSTTLTLTQSAHGASISSSSDSHLSGSVSDSRSMSVTSSTPGIVFNSKSYTGTLDSTLQTWTGTYYDPLSSTCSSTPCSFTGHYLGN